MSQIQTPSLVPVEPKLVVEAAGGDMRVAPGLHIRIHANGNSGDLTAAFHIARRLLQQDLQFRFRFHVEKKNPAVAPLFRCPVAQCFAYFLARLADPRKNDAIAAHANALQHGEFATRDDIEAVTTPGQVLQNRQIAVRFTSETKGMWERAKSVMQLLLRVINGGTAINVGRSADLCGNIRQAHAFARHRLCAQREIPRRFPREMRRKRGGIDESMLSGGNLGGSAHRTLSTTSVRSSARGAPCANHSTSRKTWSASSAAFSSCCSSMILRQRSVPKNWPSLLAVFALPSE